MHTYILGISNRQVCSRQNIMASFKLGTEPNEELPVVGWLLGWYFCCWLLGGAFCNQQVESGSCQTRNAIQYTYLKAFANSMQSVSAKYVSSYFTKKMTVAWRQHDFESKSFPGSGQYLCLILRLRPTIYIGSSKNPFPQFKNFTILTIL